MSGAKPDSGVASGTTTGGSTERESRGRLVRDGLAIATYAMPVGLVFGLTALQAGYSVFDVAANSALAFAGGAQFAAAGLVKTHSSWLAIAGVVALINARHLLYSAALTPYLLGQPRPERAVMAHFLTDETFALALAHFRRIGGFDRRGYWLAAMFIFVPWQVGSTVGYLVAGAVDTNRLGLDVAFPAAMAGLSLGMVSGRRDAAAAMGAVVVAVTVGLVGGPSLGLVAGAVLGPLFGLAIRPSAREESSEPERPEPSAEAGLP
ncbi:MAG: AzlC family ABC transporter permease [Candidatus Limnocylindrales bacterium]